MSYTYRLSPTESKQWHDNPMLRNSNKTARQVIREHALCYAEHHGKQHVSIVDLDDTQLDSMSVRYAA